MSPGRHTPGRSRALRVLTGFLLFASLLTWVLGSTSGAWSSDDGAVAVWQQEDDVLVTDVATDAAGNSVSVGGMHGDMDANPGAGVYLLSAVSGEDPFMVKLDSSGDFVCARAFETTGHARAMAAATGGPSGHIFVGGLFSQGGNSTFVHGENNL